ncbi:MAG: OmpH family outer membrane protein [Planctomycetes bacterium]|nr:OmpH family outer membrane protein [Planctomycetota bacterium]
MRYALFLAAVLCPAGALLAGEGDAPRPPRIGAVNIVRVFDELEEKVDMNAELRQIEEKRAARLKQLDDQIRELEKTAKLLRPDSAEAKENTKLLEDASREFRSYRDATEDQLYNKLYDFTLGIYRKIRDEVQAYAREAGYDAVLRSRDPEVGDLDKDLRPRTRYMELNRRIDAQGLLYHSPALDFTDAIIKRLNDKYQRMKTEKERLAPPKPPTPAPEKGTEKEKPKEPSK